MERHFYNDDFEDLIKQKADQYKMYPSENVWKQIHRSLHSRRKWYWSGFVLLLSGVSYFAINELITPRTSPLADKKVAPLPDKPNKAEAKIIPFKEYIAVKNLSDKSQSDKEKTATEDPELHDSGTPASADHIMFNDENSFVRLPSFSSTESDRREIISENQFHSIPTVTVDRTMSFLKPAVKAGNEEPAAKDQPQTDAGKEEDIQKINWLQEMAVYELTIPKVKRTSFQFSFSPTMNYRKLTGSNYANLRSDAKNIPMAMNIQGDLNGLLNHKPALGFEMGSAFLYAVNKNVTLKAGLQFNYSRYDIIAYRSVSMEIATIALTDQYGVNSDSLTSYTHLRNFGGDAQKDLINQYFQVSAPVGMEWRIFGNDRLQFKVAGTVQPTYLINRNTYLVTTDYKNYTREPSLVRRWNVNAGAEAFISYRSGGVRWQLGPQVRYQLLSSYSNKYPIKEYLMEYGVKLGVSKTIK